MILPKPFLIVNPRSGTGEETPSLVAAAGELGVETHVLSPGEDAASVARSADASVLGIAGGDGTLGVAAGIALERGLPFVCVPFGTRNHFARDLGLEDPVHSLTAFTDGVERVVDVGRAGSRVFMNNVSIGAYADYVHGLHLRGLRKRRVFVDGAEVEARIVLFANNAYSVLGRRDVLDEGLLHLYVAHGWLRLQWDERASEQVTVADETDVLEVAIDGEPVRVESPLTIQIEPRALTVLVPREHE
jgi:diacylglycerol kinase family enzyme